MERHDKQYHDAAMAKRWEYVNEFSWVNIICWDEQRQRIGSAGTVEMARHICDLHNDWLAKQATVA